MPGTVPEGETFGPISSGALLVPTVRLHAETQAPAPLPHLLRCLIRSGPSPRPHAACGERRRDPPVQMRLYVAKSPPVSPSR